ncbi:MAG: hypothetical protein E6G35_02970 [Actinobacteria bacterium]|nr:MAG: hypothetical protein E6G35_02970 [Actinomycetota bacterium]
MPEQRRLDAAVITVDGTAMSAALYGRMMLVSTDVFIDGQPAATATSVAQNAPPHLPPPGTSGRHELVVTGLDLTHRLARGPKTRTFLRMTESDIASRIAGEYGLDTDIDAVSEAREYVLQAGETDYAFLKRIAGRIGYDLWIAERTFFFKRKAEGRSKPYTVKWGENLTRFSVRFASSEHCDEVVVKAWNPLDKTAITGRSSSGDPGTDAPAADEMAAAARHAFGRITRSTGQFPASSPTEADALADSLILKASGGAVVLRGEANGNPWLGAGADVSVERVGRRLAGKYRVTSVEHVYGADRPYVTRFVCGGKEAADMADLLRGAASTPGGLIVGLVTNNDDPEHLGRVKVRFPTLSDSDESTWARVATLGAGPSRGMQWLPEVGDEVLVGFELEPQGQAAAAGRRGQGRADHGTGAGQPEEPPARPHRRSHERGGPEPRRHLDRVTSGEGRVPADRRAEADRHRGDHRTEGDPEAGHRRAVGRDHRQVRAQARRQADPAQLTGVRGCRNPLPGRAIPWSGRIPTSCSYPRRVGRYRRRRRCRSRGSSPPVPPPMSSSTASRPRPRPASPRTPRRTCRRRAPRSASRRPTWAGC